MKKVFLFLFLSAAALYAQTNSEPVVTPIDGYAARVNDRVITYGEIRQNVAPIARQLFQRLRGEDLARQLQELYNQGRETLLDEALIQEEAKRQELTLPPEMIDDEIDRMIETQFDGSRARLARVLAESRKTMEEWREEIADQLVMQVYYNQQVLRKIDITGEDIRTEYDRIKDEELSIPFRVKYRFILINKGRTPEEQAVKRKQAERVLQRLRDGADFAALAEDVSEGDTSLSPWRDPADVKEAMRPALRETPAGGISDLIDGGTVFYIVNVESRQEKGYVPLEKVREQIQNKLFAQERERLHEELIDRISGRHYVKRY